MYQVFVVEDESLIRQSIRHIVESMSGPFSFCGEASDGEMALSMMQDLMPDILLTDIRMPFLDGFELIRHVKSMMPWIKIVIISGFGDFEYAQKAISLGANKYLLKPLRAADLTKAIEELAAQIEHEHSAERLPSGYDRDELNHVLHQHFMHQLLGGSAETGVLLERARQLNLEVIRPLYQPVLFAFSGGQDAQSTLQAGLMKLLGELQLPLYYLNEWDQLTLLICGNDAVSLNEETYRLIRIIRHEMEALSPAITTVVGSAVSRLSPVCDAYRKAKELLRSVSGIAPGQVVETDDTTPLTSELLSHGGPFGPELQRKLAGASAEDVPGLLHGYFHGEGSDQFNSMLMRYYALVDILKMTMQMKRQNHADDKQLLSQASAEHDLFAAAATRQGFEQLAEKMVCEAVAAKPEIVVSSRIPPVIARADAYVAEHFCDPNISLMSVARHVGMSSAHFSTVFSQAHGTPFISYLTGLRIERAKKLLADSDMKLAAIAMEIGYNEPNYFSHVFRKAEGITPKEYRQKFGVQE